jgi:hypothetical protein
MTSSSNIEMMMIAYLWFHHTYVRITSTARTAVRHARLIAYGEYLKHAHTVPATLARRLLGRAGPVWRNHLKQLQKTGLRRPRRASTLLLPRLHLGLLDPVKLVDISLGDRAIACRVLEKIQKGKTVSTRKKMWP